MPMSESFKKRLYEILPEAANHFGTPFHIYDEKGIRETGENLKKIFEGVYGFKEFFAVKACPNLKIMKIMKDMGFGFDCSSIPELFMARQIGTEPENIIFTSNNTSQKEYEEAFESGGCILNLDDISFIEKIPAPPDRPFVPDLICFRYNPGSLRDGNSIIGKPEEAKYGIRHDQIIEAYKKAKHRGATRFGLHTMICSNQMDYKYLVETVKMLLGISETILHELGIVLEFINMGGGLGIPYRPDQQVLDVALMAKEIEKLLNEFRARNGYVPKLFMESGRYITGPHGVLVTQVINRMNKYRQYVGVDASMSAMPRPAIYGAYHHIDVFRSYDNSMSPRKPETVDVVGSLCENNDKFAIQRELPETEEGDLIIIEDAGAHGYAMGSNYNGRLRPQELILRADGSIELIRRTEYLIDYIATQIFEPRILRAPKGNQ